MSIKNFKLNEKDSKLLIHLLSCLKKRIYLLRVSLYGETEKIFPNDIHVIQDILEKDDDYFRKTHNLSAVEYKLMADSCEIETCIRRILEEMERFQTFKSLKDVIMEFENESTSFKKHQKMIQAKKKQIEQLKEALNQEQSFNAQSPVATLDYKDKSEENANSFCETEFLNKLMGHRVKSRKKYYDYKQAELEEKIEEFRREARVQVHADAQTVSFWLLKYNDCSDKLDIMLKEVFDNWTQKRRNYEILKKYRRLNLERIQKTFKLTSEMDYYIEKYRIKKEKQQKEREEELRRQYAATTIQAYWRGTMVRKHLGPYKIKKKKSKKGKKAKGKKETGKKKK